MIMCPHCQTGMSSDHVDSDAGVGLCPTCEQTFELARAVITSPGAKPIGEGWENTIPAGWELARTRQAMVLTHPWDRAMGLKFGLFAVAMLVFAVYGAASVPAGGLAIGALAGLGAAISGYGAAAFLLNSTTLVVANGQLVQECAPLPWPGAKTLQASSLMQLFVREQSTKVGRGGRVTRYILTARVKGGQEIHFEDFPDPRSAQFIERAVEAQLGIEDAPMHGEY